MKQQSAYPSTNIKALIINSDKSLLFYLAELVNHWWDLETLLENGALTLHADILGPFDEAGQVTLWLDITTLKIYFSLKLSI